MERAATIVKPLRILAGIVFAIGAGYTVVAVVLPAIIILAWYLPIGMLQLPMVVAGVLFLFLFGLEKGLKRQWWGWAVLAGSMALAAYFTLLPIMERRAVAEIERANERVSDLPLPLSYNREMTVVRSFDRDTIAKIRERKPPLEETCHDLCASLLFSRSADRVNVLRAERDGSLLLGRTFYLDNTVECPRTDFDAYVTAHTKSAVYALDGLCIGSRELTEMPSGIYVDNQTTYGRNLVPGEVYRWVQIDHVDEAGTHFIEHASVGKAKEHIFPPIFASSFFSKGGIVHRLAYRRIPFGHYYDLDKMLTRITGTPMTTNVPSRKNFELTAERARNLAALLPRASPRLRSELRIAFKGRVDVPYPP